MLDEMFGSDRKAASAAEQATQELPLEIVRVLVENRPKFLAFVQRQVQCKDVAEDILQEGFARGIDRIESLRDEDAIGAWFRRVLRNAVYDYFRRGRVATQGLEALAKEIEHTPAPHDESHEGICKCVSHLVTTLKPEYAEALQRIEVDGVAVKDFAQERGLSSANAGVRVFRARAALRRLVNTCCGQCATDSGCLNCTCGGTESTPNGGE
jgi:RNA polymerase sigma factor (sigma-70 family)